MLVFCGFNGFQQFGNHNGRNASKPTKFLFDDNESADGLLIAVAWSYVALARENIVWLKGFLLDQPNGSVRRTAVAPVKQLSACDKFCLVLLETGLLFKMNLKSEALELQEIKIVQMDERPNLFSVDKLPRKRGIFGNLRDNDSNVFKIMHVASGENIACAVSSTNAVYNLPSKIYQLPKHLRTKQLVCGFEHALLLTSNGDIYAWGNGLRGQLGLESLAVKEEPTLIEALAGIKIINVSANGWHSAAISSFGDVYTWGFNSNGQLGLKVFKDDKGLRNPAVYPLPQLINLPNCCMQHNDAAVERKDIEGEAEAATIELDGCSALQIFTAARHTLLMMSCGAVYGCGWNAYGQLGLDNTKDMGKTPDLL